MRSIVVLFGLLASMLIAAPALAAECPGNPRALGTSRTLVIDPAAHPLLGSFQYRESLPLEHKEVVITFDDGPLPPYTTRILDILARECVKATFFMVGRMARTFPKVVHRVYDEGHTLANHSQNHPFNFATMSLGDAAREIDDGFNSIAAAIGDPAKVAPFFRFPGLGRQNAAEQYLASKQVMSWSVDFMADDWTRISASEVTSRALARLEAKGKGILLLHDIQPATALALPELLRELKARGYRVVHVVPASATRPATVAAAEAWQVRNPPRRAPIGDIELSLAARTAVRGTASTPLQTNGMRATLPALEEPTAASADAGISHLAILAMEDTAPTKIEHDGDRAIAGLVQADVAGAVAHNGRPGQRANKPNNTGKNARTDKSSTTRKTDNAAPKGPAKVAPTGQKGPTGHQIQIPRPPEKITSLR
jgi:peptidoglycan/xylan/chitin deacetylase (PgdA/CDA1 family)